jgi:hypothetical protein
MAFLAAFLAIDAAFRGNFAMCGALLVTAILMRMELDKIKDWAEKF